MNEDVLNMTIRQYLKRVGVTSQREIEHAILKAVESGGIQGDDPLDVDMTMTIPALELTHIVKGKLAMK
jgi:hypothetical protein